MAEIVQFYLFLIKFSRDFFAYVKKLLDLDLGDQNADLS